MTPHNTTLITETAHRWYGVHHGQYLARDRDTMVDACTQHLSDIYLLSATTACQMARQALADIEAEKCNANAAGFIDIDRSTSRLLVLQDTINSTSHMVTLPELIAFIESREEARAAA